tara:strand:+ start:584 stop:793 length:210 start_codon:yes stop_codon:yes gene_type:complete
MIKVLVTICFLNPLGFWDGCTLYTSTEEITSKNECKEKIDEFAKLAERHVFLPHRIQGRCVEQYKGENI